ncbi:MAG: hypothetical protein WC584_02090 [Candidatus Pacearchaeota archaeon]
MIKIKGQVWIETVIYTLIALAMIGAVLSFAKPKIEQMQDKSIIEDTVEVLEEMNTIILDVRKVSGNQRVFDLGIKKGSLTFNAINEKISFEIESKYKYSQIGEKIKSGSVEILTEELSSKKNYKTNLTLDYSGSNYDLQLKGNAEEKQITKASSLYKIYIVNKGKDATSGKTILEFEID